MFLSLSATRYTCTHENPSRIHANLCQCKQYQFLLILFGKWKVYTNLYLDLFYIQYIPWRLWWLVLHVNLATYDTQLLNWTPLKGRTPHGDGDTYWSEGCKLRNGKHCWKPWEARRKEWSRSFLGPSEEMGCCQHLDLRLPSPEWWKNKFLLFWSCPLCGDLL